MRLVETLAVGDDADVLDAHLAFQLDAGVDLVLAACPTPVPAAAEILEPYVRAGRVLLLDGHVESYEPSLRTRLIRLATAEHGADWVIDSDADEFWWPRGESLTDALETVPAHYGTAQALVRVFAPRPGEAGFFADRMTARFAPDQVAPGNPRTWTLRQVHRGDPGVAHGTDDDPVALAGLRPLRAWYPIEVLRFPLRSLEQAERRCARDLGAALVARSALEARALEAAREGRLSDAWAELAVDDERLATGLAEGTLAVDGRLRDALRLLRAPSAGTASGVSGGFQLPDPSGGRISFRASDVVDDAIYAADCAAVGEVDVEGLEQHIAELEWRIARLEARPTERILRALARRLPRRA